MYKYIFTAVFLIVIGAWFSNFNVPRKSAPAVVNKPIEKSVTSALLPASINKSNMVAGGKCNVERVNGIEMSLEPHILIRGEKLILSGWAFDDVNMRIPPSVILNLDNNDEHYYYATQVSTSRPDVAEYFKLPGSLANAGFEFAIESSNMKQGEYSIALILSFQDAEYVCENGRKIVIQ